jgi:hypothetical protein
MFKSWRRSGIPGRGGGMTRGRGRGPQIIHISVVIRGGRRFGRNVGHDSQFICDVKLLE